MEAAARQAHGVTQPGDDASPACLLLGRRPPSRVPASLSPAGLPSPCARRRSVHHAAFKAGRDRPRLGRASADGISSRSTGLVCCAPDRVGAGRGKARCEDRRPAQRLPAESINAWATDYLHAGVYRDKGEVGAMGSGAEPEFSMFRPPPLAATGPPEVRTAEPGARAGVAPQRPSEPHSRGRQVMKDTQIPEEGANNLAQRLPCTAGGLLCLPLA
jgi:hypothetical protein